MMGLSPFTMKFITTTDRTSRLAEIAQQMKAVDDHAQERHKFLRAQIKALHESTEKDHKKLWEQIEEELRALKLLPDGFEADTHGLSMDQDRTQIFSGQAQVGIGSILNSIFNS